jgi:protein tyrosine kinase modulator
VRSDSDSVLGPRERLDAAWALARRALAFWQTALVVLLLGELACAGYFLLRPPRYRSQTVLLYGEIVRAAETGEPAAPPKSLAQRMRDLATGRQQLRQVVEEFELYPDIRQSYGTSDAVDELKRHVEFHAPGGDTFTLSFEGDSPEQAERVTARLAELVIDRDANLRQSQATAARDFLAGEKKHAQTRLRDAEQELATFMAEHPRFALDTTPLATGAAIRAMVGSGAGVQSKAKAAPRTRLVAVPGPREKPPAEPAIEKPAAPAPPSAAEIETRRELEAERARAAAAVAAAREDLTLKRSRYTDAHPDVRAARDALARAEARLLVSERRARLAAAPEPVPAPPARAKDEKDQNVAPERRYVEVPVRAAPEPSNATPSADDLVTLETDWSRLTRAVTEARQRHDQVEAALFKADIASSSASGGQSGRITVIDPAFVPPRPIPPGRRTLAALFFVASALAGVLAALARAALDDRIHDRLGALEVVNVLVEVPRQRVARRAHV